MRKYSFALMLMWGYLLVVSYHGLSTYSGTSIAPGEIWKWQLMLYSIAGVPLSAWLLVKVAIANANENVARFRSLNYRQLKIYLWGLPLLPILIGAFILAAAACFGIAFNTYLIFSPDVEKEIIE